MSRRDGNALDLDRARDRIAVRLERFKVELDRFPDHRQGLRTRLALADTARKARHDHAVAAPGLLGQDHVEFARGHSSLAYWRDRPVPFARGADTPSPPEAQARRGRSGRTLAPARSASEPAVAMADCFHHARAVALESGATTTHRRGSS